MWYNLSHLTALTSNKIKLWWTDIENKAFDEIKRIVAFDTLSIYTDFDKHFDIHAYASYFHIGAVIIQYGKPIVFHRGKLTWTQTRYTVMEKELLSIFKTLKEFCTVLLGQHTKNLTHQKSNIPKLQHRSSVTMETNIRRVWSVYWVYCQKEKHSRRCDITIT